MSSAVLERTQELWIEVAEMYKKMGRADIYRSIYEKYIACKQHIKDAIKCEEIDDFEGALTRFRRGLNEFDESGTKVCIFWVLQLHLSLQLRFRLTFRILE